MVTIPAGLYRRAHHSQHAHATTPPGLVTIAPGGSEGAEDNLSAFRWAQTANFGALPNQLMPRAFAAQVHLWQYMYSMFPRAGLGFY